MAKRKMVIVEAVIEKWGVTIHPGKPYVPEDSNKYNKARTPVVIRAKGSGCVIEHEDGTEKRYPFASLFYAPVCNVCQETHPDKTEAECELDRAPVGPSLDEEPDEEGTSVPEVAGTVT